MPSKHHRITTVSNNSMVSTALSRWRRAADAVIARFAIVMLVQMKKKKRRSHYYKNRLKVTYVCCTPLCHLKVRLNCGETSYLGGNWKVLCGYNIVYRCSLPHSPGAAITLISPSESLALFLSSDSLNSKIWRIGTRGVSNPPLSDDPNSPSQILYAITFQYIQGIRWAVNST